MELVSRSECLGCLFAEFQGSVKLIVMNERSESGKFGERTILLALHQPRASDNLFDLNAVCDAANKRKSDNSHATQLPLSAKRSFHVVTPCFRLVPLGVAAVSIFAKADCQCP